MSHHMSRRQMLRHAGLGGATLWFAGHQAGAARLSANEKLNLAFVGAGGRGEANLGSLSGENIVALCDVDQRRAAASFARFPQAKKYTDFRRMLDELDRQIDAVVVSAPNHIHAPASVMAMKRGKHCYCEKPLSHSVYEARVAAQVAAEKKVATQMGTQIHAGSNYRRVVELIQAGAIGPVRECHVWLGGGETGIGRPKDSPAVPAGLDWDLWLGPAPARPYHPCYLPRQWHFWWDFGGGTLGNMGCHYLDLPFWALKLRHPVSIEAEGPPVDPECTPKSLTVRYEFPAREKLPPVTVTWYHGQKPPHVLPVSLAPKWGSGVLFVGQEGMLLADYTRRLLLPEEKFIGFKAPPETIPPSIGHHQEWVAACKTGSPTLCNFDYAGALTEAVLLGNVAYRVGKRLQWDADGLKATNGPEAEQYLRRSYRQGWTLEGS